MITLCGFSVSNYYNKVKLALLEKGIEFTEEYVNTGSQDEAVLSASPLGKVPFIRTDRGTLCESQVIVDWLEAEYPTPALLPADAFGRAKQHELITFIELHVELVARELYMQAFFGGTVSDETQARVKQKLDRHIPALMRLTAFKPYVAGSQFTMADCAAYTNLPLVAMSTKAVYGEDLLLKHGLDWKSYVKLMGERPSVQRVDADRKADTAARVAAAAAARK